ncbi:MAG TPA: putative Ig domain-containing protein, partial [Aggregatilineales bacterium]|nr:putative Ig domain-containing protein [Aggregatilineales bacterium]
MNIVSPMRITAFDMNIEPGTTTVSVYYRSGTYVGSETNPAAWTLMGTANVSGAGLNRRTRVNVSSPVLNPGTYGFYVTVTPTLIDAASTDMFYSTGSRTYSNSNLSIVTGVGVGGLFGDRNACIARGFVFQNPCIFPQRTWNGTIYYDTVAAPSITSGAPASGTVGTAYSHTYTASGTAPITFAVSSGALPPGLTLTTAGVLSGTPTTAGTFTGTVTASNGVAPSASQPFSITINPAPVAPSITSAAPASGTVGTAYSHTYTASGTAPISFALTSGALPPGLTLSSAGVLSGNPTTAGTFTGTVTASNGVAPNASQPFSITINPAPVAPSITSAAPAAGTVGTAYSHTYTASGTAP